jgi:hypothetical protein
MEAVKLIILFPRDGFLAVLFYQRNIHMEVLDEKSNSATSYQSATVAFCRNKKIYETDGARRGAS